MFKSSTSKLRLIGPFRQLLTMRNLPVKGALKDEQVEVINEGGILVNGERIKSVGRFAGLKNNLDTTSTSVEHIKEDYVALPGLLDAHTHICFAGNRAGDYAARNNGKSYLVIAKEGGGIWSTVRHTREASKTILIKLMQQRMDRILANGITTVEIKSGYGLDSEHEIKMLRAIKEAGQRHSADVVATCLAAHIVPKDFDGGEEEYLELILDEIVPIVEEENLSNRFDIFIEDGAFSPRASKKYLNQLKKKGFQITVHGDQFTAGGSRVAIECGAMSVDHLEASGENEINALSKTDVIPVALLGASIGLGCAFAPARKLLDAGCSLAIASDWNPGSAPQGDLLTQAAILGAFEKLSATEVFAGVTFRAAAALGLHDRGKLEAGRLADFIAFPCQDYREILYHQGSLKVKKVWKKGKALL